MLLLPLPAPVQEPPTAAGAEDLMQRRHRTGDWEAIGAPPEPGGVTLELAYTWDLLSNVSGGIDRGARGLGNLDVQLTAELEPLVGWHGARVFLYGLGNSGAGISRAVGDFQGVSNIEAPRTFKLFEAWLEQDFAAGRGSVLAGLFDLNSEFDVIGTGTLFLQSSHGIGAELGGSGRNGPSIFPTAALSARLELLVSESAYARVLVADGVPGVPEDPYGTQVVLDGEDGLLVAGEIGVYEPPPGDHAPAPTEPGTAPSERHHGLFGKYAIGVWRYTGTFDDFSLVNAAGEPRQNRADAGIYALAEQRVCFEPLDPVQGLSLFTRVGVADESVNAVDAYVGAGCVYRGLLPERDRDRFGLALAAAHFGKDHQQALSSEGPRDDWEIALELTYEARLSPRLSIQPTLQHVLNPGGDATLDDATVVGVRFLARL